MFIEINVTDKHPSVIGKPVIVCGNSDYSLQFTFDAEWEGLEAKTARFAYTRDGEAKHIDVVFTGDTVKVPKLKGIHAVYVGVFAGDLHTTTPARIPCRLSIRCGSGDPEDPPQDVYDQIMALLNNCDLAADADWLATSEEIESEDLVLPEQGLDSGMWGGLAGKLQTPLQVGAVYDVYIDGVRYVCTAGKHGSGGVYLGNYSIYKSSTTDPNNNEPFVMLWAGGSATSGMFFKDDTLSYPLRLKVMQRSYSKVYNKMPEDYLPESVESVILRSSTAGSSKKFKLTVDDSGALSVTEVAE